MRNLIRQLKGRQSLKRLLSAEIEDRLDDGRCCGTVMLKKLMMMVLGTFEIGEQLRSKDLKLDVSDERGQLTMLVGFLGLLRGSRPSSE